MEGALQRSSVYVARVGAAMRKLFIINILTHYKH